MSGLAQPEPKNVVVAPTTTNAKRFGGRAGRRRAGPTGAGRAHGRAALCGMPYGRAARPGPVAARAWQHGRMRERQAPGKPGLGRQITAVTGAWLPGTAEAGPAEAGTATAGVSGGPEFLINLGTSHPSAHGMLRLRLTLDGDRISAAAPEIGFMHRGAEKLFEARDYRQIIVLANRHDWLGAFASELGEVLAAERLAGIEVPPRAVWGRTMLAELNRALSHLAFLSSYPPEIAAAAGETGRADPGGP